MKLQVPREVAADLDFKKALDSCGGDLERAINQHGPDDAGDADDADVGDGEGLDDEHDDGGEDGGDEIDNALPAAPPARRGFKHAEAAISAALPKGARVQYRFDEPRGWRVGVVTKVTQPKTQPRYQLICEDNLQVEGIEPASVKHGPSKRWVMWHRDGAVGMPISGQGSNYAEFEVPSGYRLLDVPPTNEAAFDTWVAARTTNAATERLFYNWTAPWDWVGGRIEAHKKGKTKGKRSRTSLASTVYVEYKFDPGTLGERAGATGSVSLVPSKYGTQSRWVIIVPAV